jgi:hypothetical protein
VIPYAPSVFERVAAAGAGATSELRIAIRLMPFACMSRSIALWMTTSVSGARNMNARLGWLDDAARGAVRDHRDLRPLQVSATANAEPELIGLITATTLSCSSSRRA